jgi:hypothetical protein
MCIESWINLEVECHLNKVCTHSAGKGSSEEGFLGTESPPSQSASATFSDHAGVIRVESRPGDEEVRNLSII